MAAYASPTPSIPPHGNSSSKIDKKMWKTASLTGSIFDWDQVPSVEMDRLRLMDE